MSLKRRKLYILKLVQFVILKHNVHVIIPQVYNKKIKDKTFIFI